MSRERRIVAMMGKPERLYWRTHYPGVELLPRAGCRRAVSTFGRRVEAGRRGHTVASETGGQIGVAPAKLRDGYANFVITEPPLKLVLIEGQPGEDTRMDHLGVEVESADAVQQAATRLGQAGLTTDVENDTTCCYALQDKIWVHGPGSEPWEVYIVKADADSHAKQQGSTCCATTEAADQSAEGGASASTCC